MKQPYLLGKLELTKEVTLDIKFKGTELDTYLSYDEDTQALLDSISSFDNYELESYEEMMNYMAFEPGMEASIIGDVVKTGAKVVKGTIKGGIQGYKLANQWWTVTGKKMLKDFIANIGTHMGDLWNKIMKFDKRYNEIGQKIPSVINIIQNGVSALPEVKLQLHDFNVNTLLLYLQMIRSFDVFFNACMLYGVQSGPRTEAQLRRLSSNEALSKTAAHHTKPGADPSQVPTLGSKESTNTVNDLLNFVLDYTISTEAELTQDSKVIKDSESMGSSEEWVTPKDFITIAEGGNKNIPDAKKAVDTLATIQKNLNTYGTITIPYAIYTESKNGIDGIKKMLGQQFSNLYERLWSDKQPGLISNSVAHAKDAAKIALQFLPTGVKGLNEAVRGPFSLSRELAKMAKDKGKKTPTSKFVSLSVLQRPASYTFDQQHIDAFKRICIGNGQDDGYLTCVQNITNNKILSEVLKSSGTTLKKHIAEFSRSVDGIDKVVDKLMKEGMGSTGEGTGGKVDNNQTGGTNNNPIAASAPDQNTSGGTTQTGAAGGTPSTTSVSILDQVIGYEIGSEAQVKTEEANNLETDTQNKGVERKIDGTPVNNEATMADYAMYYRDGYDQLQKFVGDVYQGIAFGVMEAAHQIIMEAESIINMVEQGANGSQQAIR